jgi:Aminopeptidase P, N-terminal domain
VTLFAPKLPDSYALWLGSIKTPAEIQERYGVCEVRYVSEASSYLAGFNTVYVLPKQALPTAGEQQQGAEEAEEKQYTVDCTLLRKALINARMLKSADELALMRYASQVSSRAHEVLMREVRAGLSENHLHSEFLHHCYSCVSLWRGEGSVCMWLSSSGCVLLSPSKTPVCGGVLHSCGLTLMFPSYVFLQVSSLSLSASLQCV